MAFDSNPVPKKAHNKAWKIPHIKMLKKLTIMKMFKKNYCLWHVKEKIDKKYWLKKIIKKKGGPQDQKEPVIEL